MTDALTGLIARCEARVGKTLVGKWRLDYLLDVGGMAAVYAATHRNGNRVAVKILHPELAYLGDLRDRFLKEGYVANKVGHRGAVRTLDDDVAEDGSAFIVMELLEGETLHTRMDRHGGRITADDLLCVIDKVLEVLIAAHAQHILHRDIKPANIFVTLGAEVKLLDFGIARVREAAGGVHAPTMPGTVLGTPGFIPPEQALGRVEVLDARSDVWAVGATMFAALAGRCAHEAETVNEQIVLAATRPAPSILSFASAVPASVAAVVDRALAFKKDDRFESAAAMQTALQEAFHQMQGYRLSRGDQMAHVASELRDLYESGDDAPDEHTTVPRRKWPLRATVLEEESEALRAIEATQHPKTVELFPGTVATLGGDAGSEAPQARPSAGVHRTIPAHPAKEQLTPHGIVTPSPARRDRPFSARLGRWGSGPMSGIIGAALGVCVAFAYHLLWDREEQSSPPIPLPSSSVSIAASATASGEIISPVASATPTPQATQSSSTTPRPSGTPRSSAAGSTSIDKDTPGALNINSIPVSRVVLDGRPLGETPKLGIPVPPGRHQITFVHRELGTKSVSVNVSPGQTQTAAVKF